MRSSLLLRHLHQPQHQLRHRLREPHKAPNQLSLAKQLPASPLQRNLQLNRAPALLAAKNPRIQHRSPKYRKAKPRPYPHQPSKVKR